MKKTFLKALAIFLIFEFYFIESQITIPINGNDFTITYQFPDATNVEVTIFSKTTGWIAFGIGSGMSDADIWTCHKPSGTMVAVDGRSTSQSVPTTDTINHLTIDAAGSSRTSTSTTCKIKRLKTTGDGQDKVIIFILKS